jgi:hypothetical protein
MNVSEDRIERIRWSGPDDERWFAQRLFDRPGVYRRWESSHFDLVKKVAANQTPKGQIIGLRHQRFAQFRRQALFQYLRESGLTGADREAVVSAFHVSADFQRAIIAEHDQFLRANSSLLCASHLGSALLNDGRFDTELARYQEGYMEFFSLYCDWIIAERRGRDFLLKPLLRDMKKNLADMQAGLIALPVADDRRRFRRSAWH